MTGILHLSQTGFLSGLNTLHVCLDMGRYILTFLELISQTQVFGSNSCTAEQQRRRYYTTALHLTRSEARKLYKHYKASSL